MFYVNSTEQHTYRGLFTSTAVGTNTADVHRVHKWCGTSQEEPLSQPAKY